MTPLSPPPPSNLLLFIVLSFLLISSTPFSDALTTDGVLLLAFKLSILNDPLHILDTWNLSNDNDNNNNNNHCSWKGVSCSLSDSRVTSLNLTNSQLVGSLPANFGLLDRLQTLYLSGNSINGSLPDSLFSLPDLRVIDCANNLISGQLPDLVGELRSLQVLNLSDNALDGFIPRNLAGLYNLTTVSLKGNYFSGNLPGGFDRVRFMDISSNLINGSLPVDFHGGNISYLNISYNRISGEISQEFLQMIPENATLDFSFNNLTGEIPDSEVLLKQKRDSFAGNPDLCGAPSDNSCSPVSSPASGQPIPPPAMAAIPKTMTSSATAVRPKQNVTKSNNGLRPHIIVAIVVGDLAGIIILSMVFLHVYRSRKNNNNNNNTSTKGVLQREMSLALSPSPSSSSSSESKGLAKWSCLTKGRNEEDDDDDDGCGTRERSQEEGQMVTVDGETEIEVETLLKASAYILGVSGGSIMYKAVLEDGSVLAVRRVGDSISNGGERFKDLEANVRAIAKLTHPNLVRVRAFYWAAHEKLLIYEYVPNGSLANARPRKVGSSPCHMPWEVRLRIAKGVARGLTYIHDKKQVHGNLKPSNILLDMDMEPKIGDFGLDRLTTGRSGYIPGISTRHFGSKRSTASRDSLQDYSLGATPSPSASSIGCVSPYHPPESLRSLKPNSKWDVFSFGVILLELLMGKVVVSDELGPPVLAGLAVGLEDRTRILRMADLAIRVDLEGKEEALLACLKLGYNCISHVPQKRPTMKEALQTLEKATCSTPSSSAYYYGP